MTQTLPVSSDFSRHQACKKQDRTSCFIFCAFITLKQSFPSCLPHCFRRKKVGFHHFHQHERSGARLGTRWPGPRFPPLSFLLEHVTVCNVRNERLQEQSSKKNPPTHPVPHHNDFPQMINIIIKPLLVANMMLMLLSSVKSENSSLLSITGGTAGVSPLTVRMQTYCMSSRR